MRKDLTVVGLIHSQRTDGLSASWTSAEQFLDSHCAFKKRIVLHDSILDPRVQIPFEPAACPICRLFMCYSGVCMLERFHYNYIRKISVEMKVVLEGAETL